jgi:hypothetical protein
MSDASQQPTQPGPNQSSASAGYRPLVPAKLSKGSGSAIYAYVTVAAGLGLLVGVAVAIAAGGLHPGNAARGPEALQPAASGLTTLPAVYTGPTATLLSQVAPQKKTDTVQLVTVDDKAGKKLTAHHKHSGHRFWHWKKGAAKTRMAKRMPYVSPNAPPAEEGPTALQLASAAATSGPFVMGIQGEATIASYDAGSGTVETYEGQTFLLDKSTTETSAINWPDFPFNVHYRCDDHGGCTLVHGGSTASARLSR